MPKPKLPQDASELDPGSIVKAIPQIPKVIPKRAVLYARVSGDDRGKDSRNLKGQLEMCREYALNHHYQILAELPEDDRGASGASFELPQLERVREMAQTKLFEILIVREIDRLSRNLAKQLIVEDELKRSGVTIEYVLGEYPDTPEGNLMKHVRASVAEFERLKIIERMTRGRYLKVKSGSILVAKHPPFGYNAPKSSDEKKFLLVPDDNESKIVKMIFTWFTTVDGISLLLGIRQIATRLNELKVPTARNPIFKKSSGKWSGSAVRAILTNETYRGIWTYGKPRAGRQNSFGTPVQVNVPAIITEDVWKIAQAKLKRNKEIKQRTTKHQYLMEGRLRCGNCNRTLNCESQPYKSRKTEKVYFYYSGKGSFGNDTKCKCVRCTVDLADHAIWNWVKSLLMNPAQLQHGLASFNEDRERQVAHVREKLEIVDRLLADNRAQLERVIDLYISGDLEKDLLVERKTRLESTVSSLAKEREQTVTEIEAATLTVEQIRTIEEFAAEIRTSFEYIDDNFEARRKLIELLDVSGRLVKENGEFVIYAQCIIGKNILQAKKTATCARSRSRNPHRSLPYPTESVPGRARRQ